MNKSNIIASAMKVLPGALILGLVGTLVVDAFPATIGGFYSGEVSLVEFLMSWVRWSIFSGILLSFAWSKKANNQ